MVELNIGFCSSVLKMDLPDVLKFCEENGFNRIELTGNHAAFIQPEFIDDVKEEFDAYPSVKPSCIGNYSTNWLDYDSVEKINNAFGELKRVIDSAAGLGIECVSTMFGCNNKTDWKGNFELFKQTWIPVIEYAKEKNIKVIIENCPHMGPYKLTCNNLMYSPGIWSDIFQASPDNFGLNFDPSHLVWQYCDVNIVLEEMLEENRVFHFHVKDCKINQMVMDYVGVFGNGNFSYPLPGLGQIDWKSLFKVLYGGGYNGTLSIEHEDGNYGGNKVKEGLLLAKKNIEEFVGK